MKTTTTTPPPNRHRWLGLAVALAVPLSGCGTDAAQPPSAGLSTTTPTAAARPPLSATPAQPPTTDLFGNRLDVVGDEGRALTQNPATRTSSSAGDYLTAAPAQMSWQRGWGGAALPVSGSDGPAYIDHGIASGFADTPQGAALAACDAIARALAAPEEVWQNVVRSRFVGDTDAFIARMTRGRTRTPDAARYVTVPDGIRIREGYRPDFAVVDIATRTRDGYTYASWPMTYDHDDWRVRLPDDIETLWQPGVPIEALAGFGQWRTTT
ncbi:hypothetical protein [Nocardia nova]|jgi:hypothetical protein|uniref:DUF8175 domain-containing protein n=2 Tax=Nocardia nova TaxID=37330 RepID=A0A2S6A688_9NOCA|nr:hypothetical protein [Nocardia nova]PPI93957.1 hypothetical protein C5E46_23355 [Nocardia nova]PPJ28032.1 hypothetical protein C5F51_14410 [Nocardia nova]